MGQKKKKKRTSKLNSHKKANTTTAAICMYDRNTAIDFTFIFITKKMYRINYPETYILDSPQRKHFFFFFFSYTHKTDIE